MIKAIVEQYDGHLEIGTEPDSAPTCRTPTATHVEEPRP